MGYKTNDRCLEKAFDDEEIFVLMGRDANAPHLIMEWIKLSLWTQPEEKLREAFEHALKMKAHFTDLTVRVAQQKADEAAAKHDSAFQNDDDLPF